MKSPIVRKYGKNEKSHYSDLQVMYSNSRFYIGTIYTSPETGLQEPGSRDSQYYGTKVEAEEALLNKTWKQREHP